MYNEQIKQLVSKYERLEALYNIGPVQKCTLEDFVDEILSRVADRFLDQVSKDKVLETFK